MPCSPPSNVLAALPAELGLSTGPGSLGWIAAVTMAVPGGLVARDQLAKPPRTTTLRHRADRSPGKGKNASRHLDQAPGPTSTRVRRSGPGTSTSQFRSEALPSAPFAAV